MSRRETPPLRRALRRLTDPDLIGWPFFWWSLLAWMVSFYPQVFRADYPFTWEIAYGWVLSILAGQVVLFGFLLIARRLWWRRPWMPRHPAIAVWSFIIGTLLAVITANSVASALPAGDQGLVFAVEHFIFGVIGLCLIGTILMAFRHHRYAVQELTAQQQVLASALTQGHETLTTEQLETERTVETVMSEAIRSLEGDTTKAIDALNAASENVLRPLSHELAATHEGIAPVRVDAPRPRWGRILTAVTTAPLIAPRLTALIMLLFAWRISFEQVTGEAGEASVAAAGNTIGVSMDWESFIRSILELASVFFGTLAAAWLVLVLTRRPLTRLTPGPRWVVVGASAVAVAVISQIVIGLLFTAMGLQTMVDRDIWVRLLVIIPIALVSLLMGVTRAIESAGRDIRQQLDDTNHELQWRLARINQEIWDQRRTMALIVHGPIRAALISSAMELSRTLDRSDTETVELLRSRIEQARSGTLIQSSTDDLDTALGRLVELWRGTCSISVSIDSGSRERLEGDRVAAHVAEKIISEACANAIIHGAATAVDVTATVHGGRLDITVVNDGKQLDPNRATGLGTSFFSDVCLDWQLTTGPSGVTLRASIPVLRAASG